MVNSKEILKSRQYFSFDGFLAYLNNLRYEFDSSNVLEVKVQQINEPIFS